MCGRFVLFANMESLIKKFKIDTVSCDLSPSYNITPAQQVHVIVKIDNKICLDKFHWGLVPFWAKDKSIGSKMINARMETITEKPAFRNAFKKRRCLILANGFYEWKGDKGSKQPYYISRPSDDPFVFAGLWEIWDKEEPALKSCAIITTVAQNAVKDIHHRMPVILSNPYHDAWLNPELQDPNKVLVILEKGMEKDMICHPVSAKVNSAKNNDPTCKDPIDI